MLSHVGGSHLSVNEINHDEAVEADDIDHRPQRQRTMSFDD